MCAENTATVIARGGHRGTVRHSPAHTEQSTYSTVQIQREEHCATTYVCARCVLEEQKKRSTGRHINMAGGTAGWPRYMRYGLNLNNHARWQYAPIHTKENKKHGGRVWLCVCGAAGICPPWPQRKQNKRERNVCSAPQALVARPHVTAPSARRSSRPLLMRAAGEAHRAVVMSVSVGVRVEQLGGKHTAPLTGRVQKKQLKEGRVEKKKERPY
ncbi:hypothetical protein ECC02_007983 [Trypanosoma cruzi]|uniref:Uncharacterized protein n=1 Tax=Trypanosoma cruzi TaxID=5693 RepID=A0A7J6XX74_TRYCR|nr:hypothetical protein ECC02_007983 [Trypanosoma cruzi]